MEGRKWYKDWCMAWRVDSQHHPQQSVLSASKWSWRPDDCINELIHHDHDNRYWKETLIRSIFSEHDAQQFLGIPLRMFPDQDRVVLKYSEDGWGVHGKIRIPCDNEEYGKSSKHSPVLFLDFFWKDIWSVIVAPKRRYLVWRTRKGIVSVRKTLRRKIQVLDPISPAAERMKRQLNPASCIVKRSNKYGLQISWGNLWEISAHRLILGWYDA